MKLYIDDKTIGFIFESKIERETIKKKFTFEDKSRVFMHGSYNAKKIRKVCFLKDIKKYSFLNAGFLQDLLVTVKNYKLKISELKDARTKFIHQKRPFSDNELKQYFPFDYTNHQIRALRSMLKTNIGIIKMPTSGGKTEVMIAYVKATRLPALILVNRKILAEQTRKRFLDAGVSDVGVWHSEHRQEGQNVMVATIGSVKAVTALHRYKILFADEVHHICSRTFQDFLYKTNYPIRFGFSATPDPERGDKYAFALIRQYFGNIVSETFAEELINNKVIALPKITFVPVYCKPTITWPAAYEECIIRNKERNQKICDMVDYFDKPTLILIKDVKHKQGEIIKQTIEEETGKRVAYIYGGTPIDERESVKQAFENGELDVIISTNIMNEGVSIKSIRVLINASGGKSKVENLQKLGRGVRVMENKYEVAIIDFQDEGNRFTARHSAIRKRLYHKEGYNEIEIKEIP